MCQARVKIMTMDIEGVSCQNQRFRFTITKMKSWPNRDQLKSWPLARASKKLKKHWFYKQIDCFQFGLDFSWSRFGTVWPRFHFRGRAFIFLNFVCMVTILVIRQTKFMNMKITQAPALTLLNLLNCPRSIQRPKDVWRTLVWRVSSHRKAGRESNTNHPSDDSF